MSATEKKTRILAELRKVHTGLGSYHLAGQLADGREVQLYCYQRKRCAEDPDFVLVAVGEPRAELVGHDAEPSPRRGFPCVTAAVRTVEGVPVEYGAPIGRPDARGGPVCAPAEHSTTASQQRHRSSHDATVATVSASSRNGG